MAKLIQAVNSYRPKLALGRPAKVLEVTEWMAADTGMTRAQVREVMRSFGRAVLHYSQQGRAVKLPDLGIYSPTISLSGRFGLRHVPNPGLRRALNDDFQGTVRNHQHVGKSTRDLVVLWNDEHHNDPVMP